MNTRLKLKLAAAILIAASAVFAQGQSVAEQRDNTGSPEQIEASASRMVRNAMRLLENNEEDRAVGLLEAVPKMFPGAPSRFKAYLELGRHLIDKRQFDQANANLRKAMGSEDRELQAESLLLQGECQLARGESGDAAMILRRVTQDYPTSLFANDAFFLIGQIHFDAGRWARAAEAYKMVGTAVPDDGDTNAIAVVEAGQRIYVHVTDKDLAVLATLGEKSKVEFVSKSGDKESAELVGFGRGDGDFLASVITTTAPTQPYDGKLTIHGADDISVVYVDRNSEDGSVNKSRIANAKIVSTATLTFMDGAQRRRVRGVFVDQPAFIRLRDLDRDISPAPDKVKITIAAKYRERPEVAEGVVPPPPDPDAPWITRSTTEIELTETADRSGVFTGRITARVLNTDTNLPPTIVNAGEIGVFPEDRLEASYEDKSHLGGPKPEMRTADAAVLVGGSTEPQSIVANASDATIQAKKLLLEAQLLHKWGTIFKDVGLDTHAAEKAEEGLLRIEELMSLASRFNLERQIIEDAFAVKWDLQLVQGKFSDAIATCRQLVRLYPDTTLADRAFMQIGKARMEDTKNGDGLRLAIQVFNVILTLPNSPFKAEAQYRIGEAIEQQIKLNAAKNPDQKPDFSPAMVAFKRCAEAYPESAYAGDSFKKVTDYYISIRDYARCVETLERVFQDYPDVPWLDEMLLKWGVVLYRQGNRAAAVEKFQRLVEEYPGGQAAAQGQQFLRRLTDD